MNTFFCKVDGVLDMHITVYPLHGERHSFVYTSMKHGSSAACLSSISAQ